MRTYYRKSFDIAGYVFFADIYCASCGEELPEVDPEGNDRSPIFVDGMWEFSPEVNEGHTYNCAQCGMDTTEW